METLLRSLTKASNPLQMALRTMSATAAQLLARLAPSSAILLALFACTSKPPQPTSREVPTKQAIERAQQDYSSCLHRGAVDLDHGNLPTASVAREVRSYCMVEFERVVNLLTGDMNPEAKDMFRQRARASALQETTAAVLQERRARSTPGQ